MFFEKTVSQDSDWDMTPNMHLLDREKLPDYFFFK